MFQRLKQLLLKCNEEKKLLMKVILAQNAILEEYRIKIKNLEKILALREAEVKALKSQLEGVIK